MPIITCHLCGEFLSGRQKKYCGACSKNLSNVEGRDRTRFIVRERDGNVCQKCFKEWKAGERRFDVHHIFECGLKSKNYDKIDDLSGMITYCHRCHLTLPHILLKVLESKKMIKRIPQEKIPFILEKRRGGATYKQIASIFGTTPQGIFGLCKRRMLISKNSV